MDLLALFKKKPQPSPDGRIQRDYRVNGITLTITDIPTTIAPLIIHEIKTGDYGLDRPPFAPGDVVIDIGGHIGVIALYLAKKYPFITIHSFEPAPVNYESFKQNIALNGVTNVTVDNCAVTKDRRTLEMIMNVDNTGGATGQLENMCLPIASASPFRQLRSTTYSRVTTLRGVRC